MSEDFRAGCWAKIERAKEHIQNLKVEIDAFFAVNPKPYRIVREKQAEGSTYVWKAFEDRPSPLRFSVIAGEAIHQLRSSLDHLVVAMVRKRGNPVSKRHAFPVAETAKIFKSQRNGGAIEGISDTAFQLIEAAQPYNVPHGPKYILSILHSKDIEDKHRLLVVVNVATLMRDVLISGPDADDGDTTSRDSTFTFLLPRPITKDGVELAKFASPHPKLDAQVEFMPHVAFEEFGSLPLQPVVPALENATDFVYRVIRLFDGEFV